MNAIVSEETPLLGSRPAAETTRSIYTLTLSQSSSVSDEESQSPRATAATCTGGAPTNITTLNYPARETTDPRIAQIVMIMVLAVFVYNADGSLVLATHASIASEFDSLESSSWIFTAFGLAGAATQVTFGKLSDIYGRKRVILICYAVFSLGCLIIGHAKSMSAIILGRVICGSVGAGMGLLVSILLTDFVPIRHIASWRSYINIAATAGRSIGGPLGGWLADAVGWRWSFLGQVPLFMLAFVVCWVYLPDTESTELVHPTDFDSTNSIEENSASQSEGLVTSKMDRLDITGSVLLGSAILALLFPIQLGGSLISWDSVWIPTLLTMSLVLLGLFIVCESRWTSYPLLPLVLFKNREATASFLIMGLQTSAQVSLMFSIPIFFQVVHRASSSRAGLHLFPAVFGNTIGSIMSGMIIRRTGRYKPLIYVAMISSCLCYTLLILTWHGPVGWFKSLFVMPGGFGSGVAQGAVFISLQNVIDKSHVAPALSTLYLSTTIGPIIGVAASTAIMKTGIKSKLGSSLVNFGYNDTERASIIYRAVSSVDFVAEARGELSRVIVASYINGLEYNHVYSLMLAMIGFILVMLLRDHRV
ncbi:hypothetical protein BROUX41_003059 [Berkeleyomyces rouxiae]